MCVNVYLCVSVYTRLNTRIHNIRNTKLESIGVSLYTAIWWPWYLIVDKFCVQILNYIYS